MDSVTITSRIGRMISHKELDFLEDISGGISRKDLAKRVIDYQMMVRNKGIDPSFPPIKTTEDLEHFLKIHWAMSIVERYNDHFNNFSEFFEKDTHYLCLTLNDICDKYEDTSKRCSHCAAGKGKGQTMDFFKLTGIDQRFWSLFRHAAIGRKGEPFLYNSYGNDLSSVVDYLIVKGIPEISFYFGVFNEDNPDYLIQTREMENLKLRNPFVRFISGLTYHPFSPDMDCFEQGFRYAFDSCFRFSDEISIELLASNVEEETSMENLASRFETFRKALLMNYEVVEKEGNTIITKGLKRALLSYKQPNTSVYAMGEYKKTLLKKGLKEKYDEVMGEITYPPICASTLSHKYIVIEPDGGLKNCVSFEGMHTKSQFNLFEEGYGNMVMWLGSRFHEQRDTIKSRLEDLIHKRHNMCDCKYTDD